EKAELMGDLVRTDQQPGIHAPPGPQGIRGCNQLTATLVRLPDPERAVCRYAAAFVRVGTRKARPPRRLKTPSQEGELLWLRGLRGRDAAGAGGGGAADAVAGGEFSDLGRD